jgi:hypothetical protein
MLVEPLFECSQAMGQHGLPAIGLNLSSGDERCVTSVERFGHQD